MFHLDIINKEYIVLNKLMSVLKRAFHFGNKRLCKNSLVKSFFKMTALANLKFDNAVLRDLPLDKEHGSRQRTVNGACFSLVEPTAVDKPALVGYSSDALSLLGLDVDDALKDEDFVQYFAGNKIFDGSQPAAHCYCGHQFGYFSGQLGDGAAM